MTTTATTNKKRIHVPRTMAKAGLAVLQARPDVEIALFGCENLPDYRLPFEHKDLGEIPNERLRSVYNSAAIVLDLSDYQALGRIGLEGMACGAATVLTKFGGITEYIRDGVNTLAVDPMDEAAVVTAVLRLVDDPALRARLVAEGIRTVERFSCDVEARTTSALFAASLGYENGLPGEFALGDDDVYAPEMAIENVDATAEGLASRAARGRRASGR